MKKVTVKGLQLELDENILDDMEFIDALAEADTKGPSQAVQMFFKDEKPKVYNHCRVDGRVSAEKVGELLMDAIDALGEEGKNS